ncbi:uncharacterized protein (TIGR02099 family) [Vreelandella songnenensis]|uniref:Uncharacterized protein (TIGR02099 family) n=1 Tax=Vreelandella songnenensis TaxID=1176243 RepID=A0A2T0V7X7_9GAMM|nr:AsmA-like C-terminal region-containing protein [Halomonas songnenensis]PRY66158.1 uncharacterized protein (TIGR02099 family) [Halomonas songnenensis]
MTIRLLTRWGLLLLAWGLGLTAVLLLLLRLAFSQVDTFTPRIEAWLERQIGAPVEIESLSLSMARSELVLELEGFSSTTPDGQSLFSLDQAELRLDVVASLRSLLPIFSHVRFQNTEFHLYQDEQGNWQWPTPAHLPLDMAPETEVDLVRIDAWTEWLLRQRIWVEDTRVMLHGQQDNVTLYAETLLLTGDAQSTKLQGAVNILEARPEQKDTVLPAAQVLAEMEPGKRGINDFTATLKLEVQFDQLLMLAEMFRPEHVPYLEQAGGDARLWGRWYEGKLQESRLAVSVPQLTLRHDVEYAVLRNIVANGKWQRDGDGGEAWLSGDAQSVEWAEPAGAVEGPALPRHWYLAHQPGRWELRTSAFELASLTAWRDYVFLPESVTRVLQTLAPEGQVQGLRLGQREGSWGVDAALTNLQVSPWQQAPGGGPLDAWVQARDFRGRVTFNSVGDSTLYFPDLFMAPMELDHADGIVEWVYDGPNTMISGRDLNVEWDGAEVSGGFGLVAGERSGHFGLDIDFANVDALERPLAQWLPLKAFDQELRDWLLDDIGGRVPTGSLKLSLPLGDNVTAEDISTTLALEVTQGHLPIAPDWPRLEEVEGRLRWQNQVLEAQIDHAQSHGVTASGGELTMQDETLNVSGDLHSDGASLIAFLQAIPDMDMSLLDDLEAQGEVDGNLALSLPLQTPEALKLEVNATPVFSRILYTPLNIALEKAEGELTWQQHADSMALIGTARGRFLGGEVSADMHTQRDGIALRGRSRVAPLFSLANIPLEQSRQVAEGDFQWQGRVTLEPMLSLSLNSQLRNVTSHLPEPFSKRAGEPWPWTLEANFDNNRVESRLADRAHLRLFNRPHTIAGNLHIAGADVDVPEWPSKPGLNIAASVARIDPLAWQQALDPLVSRSGEGGGESMGEAPPLEIALDTDCLVYEQACIGALNLDGRVQGDTLSAAVHSDLVSGHVQYQPQARYPLDITVEQLAVDRLLDLTETEHDVPSVSPESWLHAVETDQPPPMGMPDWLASMPDGRLRLAEIGMGERRFGPLSAYWQADSDRLSLAPVELTLGQLTARGELYWEGDASQSETRAHLAIEGGDVGSALERLDQPVVVRSRTSAAAANLGWAGAPWQFDLRRAEGGLNLDLRDGRFVKLESAPVRLVGLLNLDNLLRRLRLDFSDMTGQGTAYDRVYGSADIANGQLTLRGPLKIEAPAANLTLTGRVNLLRQELDQRLGVTLPVTQTLPIAAVAVGAPMVGGALFIADQLLGDALDRATTIHYRVQGPWTSPQVTLEGPQ